ncbi:MAG: hypothetical protein GDA36_02540, partial [Rhodobacteraceae bacterium]|nr:hypothetical protein [Paracoccaceae bacterium]
GVQARFDAPVFARFVSNAVRIGADNVLSKIDAPVDWRWCSPTRKRRSRYSGIGHQGCDLLLRFKCLLNAQWYPDPKAGVKTTVGFHAVLRPRPDLRLCPMRRPIDVRLPFSQPTTIFWPGGAVRSSITGRSGAHRRHIGAKCRPAPAAIPCQRGYPR